MGAKISVIVPIYNVEKYLGECIESIINQTYKNLEIILIDDGSTDNSYKICEQYKSIDDRIKVIHKMYGGVSQARNTALEIATGEFISFIDSDDWINLKFYEIMMKNMIKYDSDIVVCNFNYVYKDKIKNRNIEETIRIFNKEEAMREIIEEGLIYSVVWGKLYKTKLIDNIKFKENKINEDEFFTYKICAKAKRIVYIPETLYQYRQRPNSIMSNYSVKRLDGVEALYERMEFIKSEFPKLYSEDKLLFCYTCIYHYQMLLINNIVDKKAKNTLIKYRKSIDFSLKDFIKYSLKDNVYICLSWISLGICCKLRNRLKIGY